jgi:TetR/AcrR family transcriptional regulator, tetracycline repressor protein
MLPLSEQIIVDAALEAIRRDGVAELSMRSLAEELGASQMAAYYHIKNKRKLLTLVANEVIGRVPLVDREGGTWAEQLGLQLKSMLSEIDRWPGIGGLLIEIPLTANGKLLVAHMLDILREAGFNEHDATLAYVCIHTYLVGRLQIMALKVPPETDSKGILVEVAAKAVRSGNHELVEFAIDTLLSGLQVRLERALDSVSEEAV